MLQDFSWIIWSVLGSPKISNIGFGSHGHVRTSQHENYGFSVFPIMKSKSYQSKIKQNNATEYSGYSLIIFTKEMTPQIPLDTLDPHIAFFSRIFWHFL